MLAAFAGASQEAIYVFDMVSGEKLNSSHAVLGSYTLFDFLPNGRQLAVTGDRQIRYWDFLNSEVHGRDFTHSSTINDLVINRDGSLLATVATDRQVKLWDTSSGEEIANLAGHRAPVDSVRFSPDGRSLVTSDREGIVKIWNEHVLDLYKHTEGLSRIRITDDGRQLAVVPSNEDRRVLIFELGEPPP